MNICSGLLGSSYVVGAVGVAWTTTVLDLLIAAVTAPFVYVYVTYTFATLTTYSYQKLTA